MVRIARREVVEELGNPKEQVVGGCNADALGGTRVPASCRCIAAHCAMWRWVKPEPVTAEHLGNQVYKIHVFCDQSKPAPTNGYCGLAGPHTS